MNKMFLWAGVAALGATASTGAGAATPPAAVTAADVELLMPQLGALYRDLHANPELSGAEVKTSAKLAARLKALGYDVTENVGGTGVVAMMRNGKGPVLLMRADMDGLPVTEQTGLPFASKVRATTADGIESGVMHACGHDTHMASLIGAAQLLSARKHQRSGTLMLVLQPAEETGLGAAAMLDDGLYSRFATPTHAIAFHDAANLEAGVIGYTPGFALANVDSVDIAVHGVGGHGAYPHTVKDPIVLGARIVGSLQTLVSREQDPADPAVVTVGSFTAGTKHNIVPDEARLLLTVRSYSDETRRKLLDGVARIARGEAIAAGMPDDRMPEVKVRDPYTPATYNVPDFTLAMAARFRAAFGPDRVRQTVAVMGGEDFGRFYRANPTMKSMIFWVGGVPQSAIDRSKREGTELPSLHSPFWAPDADAVISTASRAFATAALDILRPAK